MSDRPVYKYLSNRGLSEAWNLRLFGILSEGMQLPKIIAWWPSNGYRLVAPLYDMRGKIVSIQARSIITNPPPAKKVRFPGDAQGKEVVFANETGIELLRDRYAGERIVIFGEGLTDYLGLSISTSVPVLSAPGVGVAKSAVGPWAKDAIVILALDCDKHGDAVVKAVSQQIYQCGGKRVRRLRWPKKHKDACEALKALGPEAFTVFLEKQILEARHGS